jgi:hypothetical protein
MSVHTCPFCELRFVSRSELEWHLAEDHHRDWSPSSRNPAGRPKVTNSPAVGTKS